MTISISRFTRRAGVVAAAAALVGIPLAAQAATAIPIDYDASGTTHVAKTNSNVALGPTKLHISLDADTFDFTGSLSLPGTRSTFTVAGFIPVSATVDFIPAAPLQGHIDLSGLNAVVTSTAKYYVRLSNVTAAGLPTFVGSTCKTKAPVTIPANTPAGQGFDLTAGGTLAGTYTIGDFQNCGLMTPLINALIPGGGNTATLNVSNGVFL